MCERDVPNFLEISVVWARRHRVGEMNQPNEGCLDAFVEVNGSDDVCAHCLGESRPPRLADDPIDIQITFEPHNGELAVQQHRIVPLVVDSLVLASHVTSAEIPPEPQLTGSIGKSGLVVGCLLDSISHR